MKIKVGDVFRCKAGEGLRVVEFDPNGRFSCQVRSMTTGEWTDFHMEGESANLPGFLKEQGAVQEISPCP